MNRTYQLIIADDEQIECRALEHKIQNLRDDLLLLPSVYDGISLIKSVEQYHPDLAIVDINMPGLNGLEAIELLKMKKMDLKIIINTSYSDFSYIQKALQLGACDYLLKPGTKEALMNALDKACSLLDQEWNALTEQKKNRAVVDSLYAIAAEKWILSLLFDQPDDKCYQLLLQNCPEIRRGGIFTVWRIQTAADSPLPGLEKPASLLTDYIRQFCTCLHVQYKDLLYLFLIPGEKDSTEEIQDFIQEMAGYGCQELIKHGYEAHVGIGRFKRQSDQFINGLQEARIALTEKNTPGITSFHYSKEMKTEISLKNIVPDCARLLKLGKQEECKELVISKIVQEKNEVLKNPEAFQIRAAAFILDLEQELTLEQTDFGSNSWILWKNYPSATGPEKTIQWISQELERCHAALHALPENENIYVAKALIYIGENYSKDISLEDVAQEIGISPFYLSRLFKQEKNITFVEILTDIRIKKAVQLLREQDKSLKEICQLSGYSNIPYFYRVFKKTTGFTVGEMRQYL